MRSEGCCESFPGLGAGLAPAAPQDSPAGALPAWLCSVLSARQLQTEASLASRLVFSDSERWILPALLSVSVCLEEPVPERDCPSSLCEERIPQKRAVKLCVNI